MRSHPSLPLRLTLMKIEGGYGSCTRNRGKSGKTDPRTTAQVKRSQSAVRERKEKAAGTAAPVRPPEGSAKAGSPGEADELPHLLFAERARMAKEWQMENCQPRHVAKRR